MWDIAYSFLGALAAGAGVDPPEHFWQRVFLYSAGLPVW
jgi:hypothetical protein